MCYNIEENKLIFTEHLLYTRSSIEYFRCIISFSVHISVKQVLALLSPFYSQGSRAQRSKVTCQRSYSRNGAMVSWRSGSDKDCEVSGFETYLDAKIKMWFTGYQRIWGRTREDLRMPSRFLSHAMERMLMSFTDHQRLWEGEHELLLKYGEY